MQVYKLASLYCHWNSVSDSGFMRKTESCKPQIRLIYDHDDGLDRRRQIAAAPKMIPHSKRIIRTRNCVSTVQSYSMESALCPEWACVYISAVYFDVLFALSFVCINFGIHLIGVMFTLISVWLLKMHFYDEPALISLAFHVGCYSIILHRKRLQSSERTTFYSHCFTFHECKVTSSCD